MYIIATYIAGYLLAMLAASSTAYSGIFENLRLMPSLILRGQVWRLVSWWLIPPSGLSIFTVIMLFLYYQLGSLLEKVWGDFLYNLYIFFGLLMTVLGAFLLYFITGYDFGVWFSTYYVSLSIFLGFALTFPNQELLFMFVIPMKIKYLGILEVIYLLYQIVSAGSYLRLPVAVMIVSSLANVILFFFLTRKAKHSSRTQKDFRRQMNGYRTAPKAAGSYEKVDRTTFGAKNTRPSVHRCAVCGRTELDAPDMEFRFCSRCNGNYEYCSEHLYTHEHK